MATARGRAQRRHVRDKAAIDHLVRDVYEPEAPDEKHTEPAPPRPPACRLRIKSARNWILARVACPFSDDKPWSKLIRIKARMQP